MSHFIKIAEFNFKFDFCARDHNLSLFKDKHE